MLIHTEVGKEEDALEKIKKLEAVKEAYPVYGEWDIIAKIEAQNRREIMKIVRGQIRSIAGIYSTATLTVMEN